VPITVQTKCFRGYSIQLPKAVSNWHHRYCNHGPTEYWAPYPCAPQVPNPWPLSKRRPMTTASPITVARGGHLLRAWLGVGSSLDTDRSGAKLDTPWPPPLLARRPRPWFPPPSSTERRASALPPSAAPSTSSPPPPASPAPWRTMSEPPSTEPRPPPILYPILVKGKWTSDSSSIAPPPYLNAFFPGADKPLLLKLTLRWRAR
jgi:hypothetical protein